jgi:CheY-like chemotaxis protein
MALIDIMVSDTGIGMSPEVLCIIFAPFTQADGSTTRRFGGTGLGLTISHDLAELMGGSIMVESTEGVGSAFHLLLPFPIGKPIAEKTIKSAVPGTVWTGETLRVLLAEDNDMCVKFGRTLLTMMGHEVVVAADGVAALAAWESGGFDIIMMDIQMPRMGGDEALALIRQRERETGQHVPVIAVTSYAFKQDRERFMNDGFDGYVPKPFRIETLAAEMQLVL